MISFNIDGIHAYDIGALLDKFGIAVRTGQHCAQPIMDHFGISGTVRVSLSFYNTKKEIDVKNMRLAIVMLLIQPNVIYFHHILCEIWIDFAA